MKHASTYAIKQLTQHTATVWMGHGWMTCNLLKNCTTIKIPFFLKNKKTKQFLLSWLYLSVADLFHPYYSHFMCTCTCSIGCCMSFLRTCVVTKCRTLQNIETTTLSVMWNQLLQKTTRTAHTHHLSMRRWQEVTWFDILPGSTFCQNTGFLMVTMVNHIYTKPFIVSTGSPCSRVKTQESNCESVTEHCHPITENTWTRTFITITRYVLNAGDLKKLKYVNV